MTGLLFDIKEFAVHDGGGIRTTVFLKGCPLRCRWCHNPEGLSPHTELYIKENLCTHCGLCRRGCDHADCAPYGRCLHVCPQNAVQVAGTRWEADALANKLLRDKDFFAHTGGGVTLSGGEPLLQWEFCEALLRRLRGQIHLAIETSGHAAPDIFARIVALCDFVYMDLKLSDSALHRRYTGVDNALILQNASHLKASGIPHTFRTPLIPGITDTPENLAAIAALVGDSPWEQLPYNALAPAKYPCVGRIYDC